MNDPPRSTTAVPWFLGPGRGFFVTVSFLLVGIMVTLLYLLFMQFHCSLGTLSLFNVLFVVVAMIFLAYFLWLTMIRHYHNLWQRAEKTNLYFASIVQWSDDAIIGQTLKGVITSWNRGAERMYGYSANEIINCPISVLVPNNRLGEIENTLNSLVSGGIVQQYESKRLCKDGRVIDALVTMSPIIDTKGKVIGASTITHDITGRKHVEEKIKEQTRALEKSNRQLQRRERLMKHLMQGLRASKEALEKQQGSLEQANERLRMLSALKDEFVATVNHELRTPLAAVKEGVNLLLDKILGPINDEQTDFLATIDKDIDRLTGLINNMLDLSKMEAGRMVLVRQRVCVREQIETVLKHYKPMIGARVVTVECGKVDDVFADPPKVMQILWNLLSNAIKYTQGDGHILFSVAQKDDLVSISVSDDGVGISDEDIPKLFRKFSQVGEQRVAGGTGLGLALCKELITMHHGTIEVDSKPGRGAVFSFTLPAYESRSVIETCFDEQLRRVKGEAANGIGMVLLDVAPFLEDVEAARSAGHSLPHLEDFLRHQVRSTESLLVYEPHSILVITAAHEDEVRFLCEKLLSILERRYAEVFKRPPPPLNYGVALCPSNGSTPQELLAAAKASLRTTAVKTGAPIIPRST